MENPGCITFNEFYISPASTPTPNAANTTLHEMYMWFGDLAPTVDDLWLAGVFRAENQGQHRDSDSVMGVGNFDEPPGAYTQDQTTTHPIAAIPRTLRPTSMHHLAESPSSWLGLRGCVLREGAPTLLTHRFGATSLGDLLRRRSRRNSLRCS